MGATEEERDAAARALDEERAETSARLLEAAEGAELDVRDAEERRGEEREEGARSLAEAEGLLEDAARRRSEQDPGELAAADELAETDRRVAQRVEEQVAAREAATAGKLAAKDAQ